MLVGSLLGFAMLLLECSAVHSRAISVQTMTNSLTTDGKATLAQIDAAAEAGADIVRVSCPDKDSTKALHEICKQSPVPIVADIHFHYRRGIEAAEAGAKVLGQRSLQLVLAQLQLLQLPSSSFFLWI